MFGGIRLFNIYRAYHGQNICCKRQESSQALAAYVGGEVACGKDFRKAGVRLLVKDLIEEK